MHTISVRTLAPETRSNARMDSWQSIVIAFVRALAAIEVAASHLRALFYPGMRTIADPPLWYQGFAFLSGFGHQAVLLFFVISGWLVGGSLLNKWQQPNIVANYAVDRLTRLWTVLLPVFLITLMLSLLRGELDTSTLDYTTTGEFSTLAFAGNLIGLQLIAVPTYGGNFALWSLSNETWYYVLFPLLMVMFRTNRLGVRTISALAISVLAILLPPILMLYFLVWLLGAACSRIQIECGVGMRSIVIVIGVTASFYCRLTGLNDDLAFSAFLPDMVLSLLFLMVLCSLSDSTGPTSVMALRCAWAGRYLAEFSFTLYLLHVPLIQALKIACKKSFGISQLSPHDPVHMVVYGLMLCGLILSAWLFYLVFEARTPQIRQWAKRKLLRSAQPLAVPA